jgi:hypothetical protein
MGAIEFAQNWPPAKAAVKLKSPNGTFAAQMSPWSWATNGTRRSWQSTAESGNIYGKRAFRGGHHAEAVSSRTRVAYYVICVARSIAVDLAFRLTLRWIAKWTGSWACGDTLGVIAVGDLWNKAFHASTGVGETLAQ